MTNSIKERTFETILNNIRKIRLNKIAVNNPKSFLLQLQF